MYPSDIPQCTAQNRNVPVSVLNGAPRDVAPPSLGPPLVVNTNHPLREAAPGAPAEGDISREKMSANGQFLPQDVASGIQTALPGAAQRRNRANDKARCHTWRLTGGKGHWYLCQVNFLGACFSQIVSKILIFYLKSGYVVYIFVTCCNISVLSHKWLSSVPGMRIITIGSIPLNLHICMGGKSAPCWNFILRHLKCISKQVENIIQSRMIYDTSCNNISFSLYKNRHLCFEG